MILYCCIFSLVGESLALRRALFLFFTAYLQSSLNQTVLRFRMENLLFGIVSVAIVVNFSMGLRNGPGFVASALGAIILPPHRYEGMKV